MEREIMINGTRVLQISPQLAQRPVVQCRIEASIRITGLQAMFRATIINIQVRHGGVAGNIFFVNGIDDGLSSLNSPFFIIS